MVCGIGDIEKPQIADEKLNWLKCCSVHNTKH